MHLSGVRSPARSTMVGAGTIGLAILSLSACGSPGPGPAATGIEQSSPAAPSTTAPAVPLTMVSVTPAASSTLASPTAPIAFTFSAPLEPGMPDPQISPATPGSWAESGATMTFTPSSQYLPYTPLTVTVPAGLRGDGREVLARAVTASFTTVQPSTQRIQQLLAELDYLPLSFTPAGSSSPLVASAPAAPPTTTAPATSTPAPATGATTTPTSPVAGASGAVGSTSTPTTSAAGAAAPTTTAPASTMTASAISVSDAAGAFAWRWPTIPAGLGQAWAQGGSDLITTGAIMAFEADHGLKVDGEAGPAVWSALTTAVAAGQTDPRAYDYISVTRTLPETLTVWQDGADIYSSPANTGVAGAVTDPGTWPVYERFTSTTMRGRNPDGSVYMDPGIPWVAYFHGGDAIHGFVRSSYGFPQSVGCVELPPSNAGAVYPHDFYGTLVTVL